MLPQDFKGILAPPKYSRLWRASQSLVDFADPYKVIYLKKDISAVDRHHIDWLDKTLPPPPFLRFRYFSSKTTLVRSIDHSLQK
jgi:hypothetical protein